MASLGQMFRRLITPRPAPMAGVDTGTAASGGAGVGSSGGASEVAAVPKVVPPPKHPVPVYPGRGIAAPAVSPQELCESQKELIENLHRASTFSYEDFDAYIRPAILNYAAYVHLLPGSESHHHCGQGGLFRHGLEVATNAAIACNARIFAFDHWASQRSKLEPRWRMCALLGGMIHDMGKPIVDVGAVDESGDIVWNPHAGSLWEWLQEFKLDYYFIHWRDGVRHKRHEAFITMAIDRILPRDTIRWITMHGGQEAMDALVMALSGANDINNPLAQIIKGADSKSVDKDIKEERKRLAESGFGGQRNLAVRLIRAMHDQLSSRAWEINRPGNPIWVTTEGVFGLYPAVISEAIDVLRAKGEQQLVRDAAAVLQSLADWGYVHPNIMSNGQGFNTWWVQMESLHGGKTVPFAAHVVRFSKEEVIPADLLPEKPVQAYILDKDRKPMTPGGVVQEAGAPDPAPTPSAETSSPESVPSPPSVPPATHETPPAADDEAAAHGDAMDAALLMGENDQFDPLLAGTVAFEKTPPLPPAETEGVEEGAAPEPLRDRAAEKDVRDELMTQAVRTVKAKWPPVSVDEANAWLDTQVGERGFVRTLLDRFSQGLVRDGVEIFDKAGRMLLVYPDAFDELGASPEEVRNRLDVKGWFERNPATPTRATVPHTVAGRKVACMRLQEGHTALLRLLMGAANGSLTQPGRRRARPIGRYIDEVAAAKMRSKVGVSAEQEDAVLIRPGFIQYVLDSIHETQPGRSPADLTSAEVQEHVRKFAAMHKPLSRPHIQYWLACDPNPVVLVEGAGGKNSKLGINPDYSVETDMKTAEAMEAAA